MHSRFLQNIVVITSLVFNSAVVLGQSGQQVDVIRSFQIITSSDGRGGAPVSQFVKVSELSQPVDSVQVSICKVQRQISHPEECRNQVVINKDQLFTNLKRFARGKLVSAGFNGFQVALYSMLFGGAAVLAGSAGLVVYFVVAGIVFIGLATAYALDDFKMREAIVKTKDQLKEQLDLGRSGKPYRIETSYAYWSVYRILTTGRD